MESTFGRIESKKFVRFNGQFRQRERTVGGSGLEKDKRNDQALPMDDGQKSQIFHLYGSH